MQLLDKQRKIVELLQPLLEECKEALRGKKVTLPTNIGLSQVPDFINLIEQSEFEFFMNFYLIDSVGSPDIPTTGQSWYGSGIETEIIGLNPTLESHPSLVPIDFTQSFNPNTTLNKIGWASNRGADIQLGYDSFTTDPIIDFQYEIIQSVPNNMTYMPPETFEIEETQ